MNSERILLIDPHVHLRDYDQFQKETLAHGLTTADRIGFRAVFEMPNTSPPVIARADIERRIAAADAALDEQEFPFFTDSMRGSLLRKRRLRMP